MNFHRRTCLKYVQSLEKIMLQHYAIRRHSQKTTKKRTRKPEVEDDGEEGQGLEEEHDDNSLVTRYVDTVAGHGTPNDVAGALEL